MRSLRCTGWCAEDIGVRVTRVLDMVRPYMQSHGGDVELVRATQDTVYIKLSGSCNGCSMSSVTLRNTVEEALHEHLPQIQNIEVVPTSPSRRRLRPRCNLNQALSRSRQSPRCRSSITAGLPGRFRARCWRQFPSAGMPMA